MKPITVKMLGLMAAVAGLPAVEARTWEVAVWRGETTAVRMPDFASNPIDGFTQAPQGVKVRFGALHGVGWVDGADWADGKEYHATLDRVDWNARSGGASVIEVSADVNAKPGVYNCGSTVIRIVDRELPEPAKWRYFLDLWQHPWSVARYGKVKPFSPEHYEKMRPLWRQLAAAGQKALTVTIVDRPWNHQCYDAYESMIVRTRTADGKWSFDYSRFDEYVRFGRECGIGPDIACYTMCPWDYEVFYRDEAGAVRSCHAKPGSAEFADYWGDFLRDFKRHLEERGWFADTYIAMDERSPEDVRQIAEFIRTQAPGFKLAMAGNRMPSDFKGIVLDNYSQVLEQKFVGAPFVDELRVRREQGYKTTFYVCCWPLRPNTLMQSPIAESFWLGVYPAIGGYDGLLRWAYNSWPANPYANAAYGSWPAGDTFLVYPNGEPSWRFLELRRGIVAAEKLWILRDGGKHDEAIAELTKKFSVQAANDGTADVRELRAAVLELVNGK